MPCSHIDYSVSGWPWDSCVSCGGKDAPTRHSAVQPATFLNEPYPGGDPFSPTASTEAAEDLAAAIRGLTALLSAQQRREYEKSDSPKPKTPGTGLRAQA